MKEYLSKIFLLIIFALVISCADSDSSFDEVARKTSPNGKADAVLIETNGGATTSFGYYVYVVPKREAISNISKDSKVASFYGATRSESAYGVNLRWLSQNELAIEYLEAKTEEVLKSEINIENTKVVIRLKSGIKDQQAPSGGMLYNLEEQKPKNSI